MRLKILLPLIWILATSCQDNLNNDSDSLSDTSISIDTIRYSDLERLFTNQCYQCHSEKEYSFYALNLDSYENIMAGSQNGQVVIPNDPINSLLYLKCAGEHSSGDRMPQGSPNYFDNNPDKLQLIHDWISFGCIE
tara:strand:- start:248 stop:655 length:408 start_codon:yes stop_codon:yes gene_type:complete